LILLNNALQHFTQVYTISQNFAQLYHTFNSLQHITQLYTSLQLIHNSTALLYFYKTYTKNYIHHYTILHISTTTSQTRHNYTKLYTFFIFTETFNKPDKTLLEKEKLYTTLHNSAQHMHNDTTLYTSIHNFTQLYANSTQLHNFAHKFTKKNNFTERCETS